MNSFRVVSRSARATRKWGAKLGRLVEGGEIIGLIGDLGVGKTCFVRGVAEGLEVGKDAWIRSPTFTLINEYQGRLPVYHIDLYRIASPDEIAGLNLRDYLYGDGVSLIEWFERLPAQEVDEYLELRLAEINATARELAFAAHGGRYNELVNKLKALKG